MISNDVDLAGHRAALDRVGRTQVPGFLQADAATRIHQCLAEEVPWTLALCDAEGKRTLPHEAASALAPEAEQALFDEVARSGAGGGYRFAYDSYMMPRAYLEGRDPGLLLHRILEFLNSPPFLSFMRQLTGAESLRRMDAQATRYRPGQFLRTHNDEHSGDRRLFAYVLNLTRRWEPDWGGLLQFVSEDGQVIDTFLPRWNSLSLFRVPVRHNVTLVSSWAEEPRFAITGWGMATASAAEAQANLERFQADPS